MPRYAVMPRYGGGALLRFMRFSPLFDFFDDTRHAAFDTPCRFSPYAAYETLRLKSYY